MTLTNLKRIVDIVARNMKLLSVKMYKIQDIIFKIFILLLMTMGTSSVYAERNEVKYFDIWEYQIEGNTLLKPETIESAMSPYLGVNKTLKIIEQARDYLQSIYKVNGYPIVVVSIPQQNVIGGKVRLQVTEGKIDRLKISGNKYFSRRELRKELPSLTPGSSLNMGLVREEVDTANNANQYRTVVPVIRPGRHKGTMEMELKVRDRFPINASLELNNRYTSTTSETRLSASIGYDHLWQKHHSFTMGYQMAPEVEDEVSVFNVNYSMPLSDYTKLVMYGVNSDSRVATVTGQGDDLTVLGNGKVFGLRSIFTLPTQGNYFHTLSAGFDYKDFGETQALSNEDDETRFNVPITYGAWSTSYSAGYRGSALTLFSVDANFGLRGINEQDEFEFKRFLAKANYFYLKASFMQSWSFDKKFDWNYSLKGQYTESPLISNEQFSAGGVDTVRGYLESTAIGDNALLARTEIKFNPFFTNDKAKKRSYMQSLGLTVFVDAARLHTLDALPNADGEINSRTALLGAGVGAELKAFKYMDASVFYAHPLNKLDDENFEDEGRVHFNLAYRFR